MNAHDLKSNSPEAVQSQENRSQDNSSKKNNASPDNTTSWEADVKQTLQLGEEFVGFIAGVVDLARVEALLAIRTLPNIMMLWLLMMPIMLLTWCAFSVLMAWIVFEASQQIGLGMLIFFLQQVLLLFVCRLLYVKYRKRMTLPYTRAQIDNFVRSTQHGFSSRGETKE